MVFKSKVILAVGAHPDDIELGCGGTLCKAVKRGVKIVAVFMTKGEKTGNAGTRTRESINALRLLGVKEIHFGDFSDTAVPASAEAIDFLEKFSNRHNPDLVLTHTVNDIHQDHRQTAWLSISAFRNVPKILAYETPRVRPATFSPTFFVDITGCVKSKLEALKCHASQKDRRYLAYQSTVSLSSFRGSQAGVVAAEAYEVVKYLEKL